MVNGIKLCTDMLNSAGHDASKEIIFLLGALSTIDPDGPHEALDMVKINNIRCSVVSLSAEGLSKKILKIYCQNINFKL